MDTWPITPIRIGDTVFCADYDEIERSECFINGRIVTNIIRDAINRERVLVNDGTSRSHTSFYLRHANERNRGPEEIDPIFENHYPPGIVEG